jgi:3-oxoacyl-[acyl-carrier protein] reductase
MDLGIAGKTALVLGASGGLGRAIAVALAAEGVRVAVAARGQAGLDETAARIRAAGGEAFTVVWDVADRDVIAANVAAVEQALGPIDILVNNTGGPPPTTAAGQDPALWLEKFNAMVLSVIAITDAVLPGMRSRKWGRIITSTSAGVVAPIANLGISNTLRAALHGWSKTLAREVAAEGVTSNIIVPGLIATDRITFLATERAKREGISIEAVAAANTAQIPLGRLGDPAEYGAVAAFLASVPAAYVTGTVVRVDGGLIASV